jgi:hypothetical protein
MEGITMQDRIKLSDEEMAKIEALVQKAITANNKKSATIYINQLELIQSTTDMEPYMKGVFCELVSYVKTASGQVREKEHWIQAVNQSIYKLKSVNVRERL